MTFENHLRSVSRAASQRLGISRKSWRVFHDRSLLGRCFRDFVLPVLKYCSAVWCSTADTHLKLLDRAVSGARFLTGGVFERDISHRRSVAVQPMLYKIRCNPVHPLNGVLPGTYVPVRVTLGALVAHRYTYSPPRCRTLPYSRTFIPLSVFLWSDLANPVFVVWDWRVSGAGPMLFYWLKLLYPTIVFYSFPSLFFLSIGWYCGAGVFGLIGCISLSLNIALPTFFNNNNFSLVLSFFCPLSQLPDSSYLPYNFRSHKICATASDVQESAVIYGTVIESHMVDNHSLKSHVIKGDALVAHVVDPRHIELHVGVHSSCREKKGNIGKQSNRFSLSI